MRLWETPAAPHTEPNPRPRAAGLFGETDVLVRVLKLLLLQIGILAIASGCESPPEPDSLLVDARASEELRFVPRSPGDTRAYVTNPRDGTLLIFDPDTAVPGRSSGLPRHVPVMLAPESPDG